MTREKKKVRSVAGQKFVPVKAEKRASAAKSEYKTRKQQNLAKKKRQKSVQEKLTDAQLLNAEQGGRATSQKRRPRLKFTLEEVSERSKALLEQASDDRCDPAEPADER